MVVPVAVIAICSIAAFQGNGLVGRMAAPV